MRTYIIKTNHYFNDDISNESTEHTHRVYMPDIEYRKLKKKHPYSRWQFHWWVEQQLEKQIGSKYNGEEHNIKYYIKSIKVER